ncbi:aluminum activated malate transporter family protein [Artemisia annua]|uniref:Aluminum activated malate transporter family protein n=1 Tax=Artemisia annua TaxID=35608 RepID=A0A2U1LD75_ARTAN|nr:aluminum activated malate transporter family protein [Artemisia annua]
MEIDASSPTPTSQNTFFTRLKSIVFLSCIKRAIVDIAKKIKKTGEDDPRRILHSFKVAFAITLVSLVYYLEPFYHGMGDAGMWAIMTVIVVFEYTVGATLCKGMNRGFATFLAGALGVAAEWFSDLFGPTVKPIVICFLVFIAVGIASFARFIPSMKRRYDYGLLIFILTFSLIAVSGYRVEKLIEMAHQRFSTIIFGGATGIAVSMCVCPVWAGEDLHKLTVLNMEKLASFLEGFGGEYYSISNEDDKSFLAAYKSVLNSKATEESLANFAWWEIGHGKFLFRHPWKQYLKIGVYTRQCAHHIEALHGYLDTRLEVSSEFQKSIQEPCMKMSSEVGKALKELALSMKRMVYPSTSATHIENCKTAIEEFNTTLQASNMENWNIVETIPVIATISILIDIIKCVETISEAVEELSNQARFKKTKDITSDKKEKRPFLSGGAIKPVNDEQNDQESITVTILSEEEIQQESKPDKK